jgi:hypothetical protein
LSIAKEYMKAFKELACHSILAIQQEVLNYLNGYDLVEGWNDIDESTCLRSCPSLMKYLKERKLAPRDIACTYLTEHLELHVDAKPVVAKLNFPIQNCVGNINYWYDEDISYRRLKLDNFNRAVPDLQGWTPNSDIITHQFFTKPIVFNSQIPHGVKIAYGPRIVLSITFFNEPKHELR